MTRHPRLTRPSTAPVLQLRRRDRPPLALAVLAATAYLEARAGRRGVDQLAAYVDARTSRVLAAMVRRHRRRPRAAFSLTLRRVHADVSRPGVANVVVVLDVGDRVVPVCVELSRRASVWTVTTLVTPEEHPRPDDADVDHPARPDWEEPASVEPW